MVVTDVSGQPIGPIFKGQAVLKRLHKDCLTLEDRTDRLSRNVGKCQYTLRNNPEERISHLVVCICVPYDSHNE